MLVRPVGPDRANIMLIGEAPGFEEDRAGVPFVGISGRILDTMLAEAGINRAECRITNVIQTRPPNNNFEVMYEGKGKARRPTPELARAYDRLRDEITSCQPNVIVTLGNESFKAVTGRSGITKWRGSILDTPMGKVIGTIHPSAILREWKWRPVAVLDLKRAKEESVSPTYQAPVYQVNIHPTIRQIREFISGPCRVGEVSFDIETESDQVTCIGLSCSSDFAMTIPFWFGNSGNLWMQEDELEIWKLLKEFLEDSAVTKIAQNGMYDCDVLSRVYGIRVANVKWDTMLMAHTLYPELPKGLDFLASVYTKIPYYKDKIASDKMDEYFEYNAKDALTTYQICQAQKKELTDSNLMDFYLSHVQPLVEPLSKMIETGVRFDTTRRKEVKKTLTREIEELQARLDSAVGHPINISSHKQMTAWLYDEMKLPKKFKKGSDSLTTNADALEVLYGKTGKEELKIVLEIRERKKLLSTYLDIELDKDDRIRCSYNIAGTETGRLSSSATARGTGTNLQNIPGGIIKTLFLADEGFTLINADYSQAEARVVAYLAGDERLIRVFESGGDIHRRNAANIFGVLESGVTDDQRQLAKRVVHASNYGMGPRTFAHQARIPEREAERLLRQYFATYPRLKLWHQATGETLRKTRILRTPFGRRRMFFNGWNESLVKEGLAYVPQSTVADLVNLAIIRLHDKLKCRSDIQLLLQVHDSIVAQAKDGVVEEAIALIRQEMTIPIQINGRTLVIPCDVKVGKNWEEMRKPT